MSSTSVALRQLIRQSSCSRRVSQTVFRRCLKSTSGVRSDATAEVHISGQRPTLVGPPDPVSNLRPTIYANDPLPQEAGPSSVSPSVGSAGPSTSSKSVQLTRTNSSPTHPYSLDEFDGDPSDYVWRLERKKLDTYNHAFWTDSNARFNSAKEQLLASLPPDASPEYKDAALSQFYSQWLAQERSSLRNYADDWNRRNAAEIMLAARAAVRRFRSRFLGGEGGK